MENTQSVHYSLTGTIMPSAFILALISSYLLFAPILLTSGLTIFLICMLLLWALIEIMAMKGDSHVRYNYLDWFFKVGGFLALFLSVFFRSLQSTMLITLGLLALVAGLFIRYLALKTLGVYFSYCLKTEKDRQRVLDHGVYQYVRHPGYLGIFLIIISLPLVHGSLIGLLASIFFSWLWIQRRIAYEEEMMINTFGESYLAYKKRTRKIIPFLY